MDKRSYNKRQVGTTDVKYQSADEGLLITAVRPNVIRLVPPLNITEKECDEAFAILHKVVSKLV